MTLEQYLAEAPIRDNAQSNTNEIQGITNLDISEIIDEHPIGRPMSTIVNGN